MNRDVLGKNKFEQTKLQLIKFRKKSLKHFNGYIDACILLRYNDAFKKNGKHQFAKKSFVRCTESTKIRMRLNLNEYLFFFSSQIKSIHYQIVKYDLLFLFKPNSFFDSCIN